MVIGVVDLSSSLFLHRNLLPLTVVHHFIAGKLADIPRPRAQARINGLSDASDVVSDQGSCCRTLHVTERQPWSDHKGDLASHDAA